MIINIDVPETTFAVSVTVLHRRISDDSMASRCFKIVNGMVVDENGENKVVNAPEENPMN